MGKSQSINILLTFSILLNSSSSFLALALQPTVGFGLSNNFLPFFPICHQLSPSSYSQHLMISFYFLFPSFPGSSPSSRPFQFLSEDLFGHPILLPFSLGDLTSFFFALLSLLLYFLLCSSLLILLNNSLNMLGSSCFT